MTSENGEAAPAPATALAGAGTVPESELLPPQPLKPSEFNMFSVDAHGFKTHWRIVSGTDPSDLNQMMRNQQALSKWLAEHNYRPDEMGRGTPQAALGSPSAPGIAPGPVAVWIVNADGSKSCSVHGPANWKPPGTSRTTGKPYTGFWSCQVRGCTPQGEN